MCGIVAYLGKTPKQTSGLSILLNGLEQLEYRGYDAAGVSWMEPSGSIEIVKKTGKLSILKAELLNKKDFFKKKPQTDFFCGIGHTRWATHGSPTDQNAHPHRVGKVVLVHNGIIENHHILREDLQKKGYSFQSKTDTEVFAALIDWYFQKEKNPQRAVEKAFLNLQGASSAVIFFEDVPFQIFGIRRGSPLVVGEKDQQIFLASDVHAFLPWCKRFHILEQDQCVCVRACPKKQEQGGERALETKVHIFDLKTQKQVPFVPVPFTYIPEVFEKNGFSHWMEKEIFEQPKVFQKTLYHFFMHPQKNVAQEHLKNKNSILVPEFLKKTNLGIWISCGSSWHATYLAKYWFEQIAHYPIKIELASEFRESSMDAFPSHAHLGFLSQSGETADVLACVEKVKEKAWTTVGLTNVLQSSLSRNVEHVFYTQAGLERGVAATKTFFAQALVFFIWALELGKEKGVVSHGLSEALSSQLKSFPLWLEKQLQLKSTWVQNIQTVAQACLSQKTFFFIGRNLHYPVALEGALKLKEIAYVHAEGYAAGELKHGPIALLEPNAVVIACVPPNSFREKILSNLQEVQARGAQMVLVGDLKDTAVQALSNHWVGVDYQRWHPWLSPFCSIVVLQLFSYFFAKALGRNIDQPRNLAKSVTVE